MMISELVLSDPIIAVELAAVFLAFVYLVKLAVAPQPIYLGAVPLGEQADTVCSNPQLPIQRRPSFSGSSLTVAMPKAARRDFARINVLNSANSLSCLSSVALCGSLSAPRAVKNSPSAAAALYSWFQVGNPVSMPKRSLSSQRVFRY